VLPSLAGCAVFIVAPFLDAFRRSFVNGMTGEFAGLAYYREIFQNPSFLKALENTGRFIGVCVPLLIALSLMLALLLSGRVAGRSALRASFLIPMAIPVASVALLWQVLFHKSGVMNAMLSWAGVSPIDWMKTDWALGCLILSYIWKNAGYTMVLFIAGLSGIHPALYEAASVDGAGKARQFFSITLPCLKPTLFTVTVLSLLNSFKAYREAYLVAGSYPEGSIYLIQHTLNNWFTQLEIEKLSAAAEKVMLSIRPGDRECEIAGRVGPELWRHMIDPTAIMVAADERISLYRHPIVTDRMVKRHVMLSVNARYKGLITTITRMLHFGRPADKLAAQFRANNEVECRMIAATRPGAPMKAAFDAALAAYKEFGYENKWQLHHQGGAMGYYARDVKVTARTTENVTENQAFCWNPSITGTKTEDGFIATAAGPLMITRPVIYPSIKTAAGGVEFVRPGMLVID
jgi:multiple sugar transport system permease protein